MINYNDKILIHERGQLELLTIDQFKSLFSENTKGYY
ncbi:hypothetical protein BB14905_01670 [Bacillus sp. B14905]|nr:hypothetical protein BB14905_01670 [Bacillus sp. B14905]